MFLDIIEYKIKDILNIIDTYIKSKSLCKKYNLKE